MVDGVVVGGFLVGINPVPEGRIDDHDDGGGGIFVSVGLNSRIELREARHHPTFRCEVGAVDDDVVRCGHDPLSQAG